MIELIDTVVLFEESSNVGMTSTADFALLTSHLRKIVYPEQTIPNSSDDNSVADVNKDKRLTLVSSLMLNKRTEGRAKRDLETKLGESVIEFNNSKIDTNMD